MKKLRNLLTAIISILAILTSCDRSPVETEDPNFFVNEFHDLDNSQVPNRWTQEIQLGGPGVTDKALRGNVTDGRAYLHRNGVMPDSAIGIRMEYDGNLADSYWGLTHQARVVLENGDGFYAANIVASYNFGNVTRIHIGQNDGQVEQYNLPRINGNFHHIVTFYQNRITYHAYRISDNEELCNIDYECLGLDISNITQIEFTVLSTTINNAWSDNLKVELLYDNGSNSDFCDEFDGSSINQSIWAIETGTWNVSGGTLIGTWPINNANRNVGNILFTDQVQPDGDFTLDIDGVVQPYGSVANGIYMVLYNSFGNKYSVGFNPEGNEIHITAVVNSNKVPIYYYDTSVGIMNTSVGALNHAQMVRQDEDYSLYINGHFIYTFQDEYFNGNTRLGLQAYGTAVYDNVCLR